MDKKKECIDWIGYGIIILKEKPHGIKRKQIYPIFISYIIHHLNIYSFIINIKLL